MGRLLTAACCTVGMLWMAALLAARGTAPSAVAMAVAAAFLPYAFVCVGAATLEPRQALRWALPLAAAAGAALVVAPPVLSDDVYRYVWDGRVLGAGIDPYRFAPDDPALAHLRDALWQRVNNRQVPTIYPPLAQLLFAVVAAGGSALPFKGVALLAHLTTTWPVMRLAGSRAAPAAFAWALNPLALSESALGGHIDALAALAIAGCVLALTTGRAWWGALLAAAASGLKLIGIVLAPLVFRHRARAALLAMGLALLPVIPLLGAGYGSSATSGLGHYARRWQGNEGPFAAVEHAARWGLATVGELTGATPGHVRVSFARPLLRELTGTPFDPRAGVRGDKKAVDDVADFGVAFAAGLLARAAAAAAVLAVVALVLRRRLPPLAAARWVLLTALLLSPQVHPWYLLWLLPLEVAAGRLAGVVWSATVLVAYGPLDGWIATRQWTELPVDRPFEYGLVLLVLGLEGLRAARDRARPADGPEPSGTATARA